jgi:phage-related protein (TIGR01555 family)
MDNGLISKAAKVVNGFFNKGHFKQAEGPKFGTYIPKAEGQRFQNAHVSSTSGMGGAGDFAFNSVPSMPIVRSPIQAQRLVESLYYTDWQAQKIVDLPVEDMLREPWQYIAPDDRDVNTKLQKYTKSLDFNNVLRQALCMERLYGGSVIMMGLKDSIDDPSKPIDYDSISPGDLLFLNPISRYRISNITLQTDPTKPHYNKPEMYMVYGHKVHRSRLLIFDGSPVQPLREGAMPIIFNLIQDGFGYPILIRLIDDLDRATGSRDAAVQLMNRASIMLFAGDIQTASAFKDSEGNVQALQALLNNISNYQAAILNSVPGSEATLQNITASFGAIPELIMTFLQVLSAACDIPATRFLSKSPSGMNSTGDSDLENYYNMIEARQIQNLEPQLEKFLLVAVPSSGVTKVKASDITIEFKPLWNATELEDAQAREINTNVITSLVNTGIIGSAEAIDELKQRKLLITNPLDYPAPVIPVGGKEPSNDEVKGSIDKIGKKDAAKSSK